MDSVAYRLLESSAFEAFQLVSSQSLRLAVTRIVRTP